MPKTNNKAVNMLRTGKTYSYWTLITLGTKDDYLICKCKCGTIREVNVYSLTSGKSRSCGCRKKLLKSMHIFGPL